MGCKYQIVSCCSPQDLLQVSFNHLDSLRALVQSPPVLHIIDRTTSKLLVLYRSFSANQMALVRQTLCRFFQDRRVKVSLFLQDGIQALDGTVIIEHRGSLPPRGVVPGTIRYFNTSGAVCDVETLPNTRNAVGVTPAVVDFDMTKQPRPCELGLNLYAKERPKSRCPLASVVEANESGATASVPLVAETIPAMDALALDESARKAAQAELSLLASLIGNRATDVTDADKFTVINLFPEADLTDSKINDQSPEGDGDDSGVLLFDAADKAGKTSNWRQSLEQRLVWDNDAASTAQAGTDDLLDLYDTASN